MRTYAAIVVIQLALFGRTMVSGQGRKPLVISDITVIGMTGGPSLPHYSLLIENHRIAGIGPAHDFISPANAQVVDGRGKFLIPGLWDMHTHIAGLAADPAWSRESLLPLLLAHGVTGVRDMGGELDALKLWEQARREGTLVGPRLYFAGPLIDGGSRGSNPHATTPENARAIVRDLKKRGAQFIKVLSNLDPQVFSALADESKIQGLDIVGHVPTGVALRDAVAAGFKSIEHLTGLAFAFSSRGDELRLALIKAAKPFDAQAVASVSEQVESTYDERQAQRVARELRESGTWMTPTLVWSKVNAEPDSFMADDPLLEYVPPSVRKEWNPDSLRKNISPADRRAAAREFEDHIRYVRVLHDAHVNFLAGSDALDPFVFPGGTLHQELELLVRAGFSPLEALETATKNPARFMKRDADFGAIEVGKLADLVLLDADPLGDIANVRRVAAIVLDGRYLARAELDRMLGEARAAAARWAPAAR